MATPAPTLEPFHVMPTVVDGRPRLVIRVGITGHRKLPHADFEKLDKALGEILDVIGDKVRTIHADPSARALYSEQVPILLFISPLAEGADRIAAKVANQRGWRLACPLPFRQAAYENDFPETVSEFRDLLAHAVQDRAVVELDGVYDQEEERRNEGYLEVGHFVMRHSDLLIAIWDGALAAGVGGTGDIVQSALNFDVPVVHVAASAPHGIALLDHDSRAQPIKQGEGAPLIAKKVNEILCPDLEPEADQTARRYFTAENLTATDAGRNHYDKGPFVASPRLPFWGARDVFRSLLSLAKKPKPPSEPMPAPAPQMPINCDFLFDHFQRADCLASAYSDIHRSLFILIYLLGASALIAGFASLAFHDHWYVSISFVFFEFVFLCCVVALYGIDRIWKWRERWLDYRLLAEMLREADLLAMIGRSLTNRAIYDHESDLAPRAKWVSKAFRAIVRAAGIAGGSYDKAYLETAKIFAAEGRLTDQIRYHDKNGDRTRSVNNRLRLASAVTFGITIVAVSLELFWPSTWGPMLALVAGALTAFAYGTFGIRNQAEFEIVGRRSERMETRLRRHRSRLREMSGDGLTSVSLGRELVRASEAMRHDVADWIGIFETKEAEAN